jgi:tripartite-type tricarboxylate transporter receptor subunit TctC
MVKARLPRRGFLQLAAGAVAVPAVSRVASGQAYPSRPIRLLVGFPPGGAADLIARRYGQSLAARLGKPVVIENRPGSGGNLAGDAVVKSAPDGYTLMHGSDNVFISNPHVYAKMPFDPLKDLVPVASLTSNQLVLAVHPAVPAANLREFVELARRSKPPLFYASIGNGSQHHLAMEMLKQHLGIDLTHVPYRGGGPAAIALLSGDISAMFGGGSIVPTIRSGQLRGPAAAFVLAPRAEVPGVFRSRAKSRIDISSPRSVACTSPRLAPGVSTNSPISDRMADAASWLVCGSVSALVSRARRHNR